MKKLSLPISATKDYEALPTTHYRENDESYVCGHRSWQFKSNRPRIVASFLLILVTLGCGIKLLPIVTTWITTAYGNGFLDNINQSASSSPVSQTTYAVSSCACVGLVNKVHQHMTCRGEMVLDWRRQIRLHRTHCWCRNDGVCTDKPNHSWNSPTALCKSVHCP